MIEGKSYKSDFTVQYNVLLMVRCSVQFVGNVIVIWLSVYLGNVKLLEFIIRNHKEMNIQASC